MKKSGTTDKLGENSNKMEPSSSGSGSGGALPSSPSSSQPPLLSSASGSTAAEGGLPDPDDSDDDDNGYKMNDKDKEFMTRKLSKQKQVYEAQLAELRAEKIQLEHKNRELTKALEDRKKSHACSLL